jgi:hypothetical protein
MAAETDILETGTGFVSDLGANFDGLVPQREEHMEFPDNIYRDLPPMLSELCDYYPAGPPRDIVLLASLTDISGALSNIIFRNVDGWVHLNLFAMVIAPPGNGKGVARVAWDLVAPIDKRIREASKVALNVWRAKNEECEEIRKRNKVHRQKGELVEEVPDIGDPPRLRTLRIGVNNSTRSFIDRLDANGGGGVLHDTEIITMINAMRQEWGDAREVYLKAPHNEFITIERKDTSVQIEKPCCSVFLTGTENAVKKLIPSAEDGLLSRFPIYTFTSQEQWRSHRPRKEDEKKDQVIGYLSQRLEELFVLLNSREKPLVVYLKHEQWELIDSFQRTHSALLQTGSDPLLLASVRRAALYATKIACLLTTLRDFDGGLLSDVTKSIATETVDVETAVAIMRVCLHNGIELAKRLPKAAASNLAPSELSVYVLLPDLPTTISTREICRMTGFKERKVQRILRKLKSIAMIHCTTEHGPYARKQMSDVVSDGLTDSTEAPPVETTETSQTTNTTRDISENEYGNGELAF